MKQGPLGTVRDEEMDGNGDGDATPRRIGSPPPTRLASPPPGVENDVLEEEEEDDPDFVEEEEVHITQKEKEMPAGGSVDKPNLRRTASDIGRGVPRNGSSSAILGFDSAAQGR